MNIFISWPFQWILHSCSLGISFPYLSIFYCEFHIYSRSYQRPPYSCWIPASPVDSCGILAEFTSQNFTPAMELCQSSIYTGMVPGVQSPEWHWNPVTRMELRDARYGKFCIFYMKIAIKLEKNRDGEDVEVLLTWSVCISFHGN